MITVLRRFSIACASASAFAIIACGDTVCAGIGLTRILPVDTTVAVGTTFVATYQEGGYCFGESITEADYGTKKVSGWMSLNPTVATVDSLTGVVTAVAVGDARISTLFGGMATVRVR
jgi:hypothetical protein